MISDKQLHQCNDRPTSGSYICTCVPAYIGGSLIGEVKKDRVGHA